MSGGEITHTVVSVAEFITALVIVSGLLQNLLFLAQMGVAGLSLSRGRAEPTPGDLWRR